MFFFVIADEWTSTDDRQTQDEFRVAITTPMRPSATDTQESTSGRTTIAVNRHTVNLTWNGGVASSIVTSSSWQRACTTHNLLLNSTHTTFHPAGHYTFPQPHHSAIILRFFLSHKQIASCEARDICGRGANDLRCVSTKLAWHRSVSSELEFLESGWLSVRCVIYKDVHFVGFCC